MSAANNGGPAFPVPHMTDNPEYHGMTLRDHFAGQAMQAEIITSTSDATPEAADALIEAAGRAGRTAMQQIAYNAYRMADAMLEARAA